MFLADYFSIVEGIKETAVCCPFEHRTENGLLYQESRPSAHVDTIDGLFHCKVCAIGYSEAQFIQKIFDCSYVDAKRIQTLFKTNDDLLSWNESTRLTQATKTRVLDLGIKETIIEELNIKTPTGAVDTIDFPVFMFDKLVDKRTYNPGGDPKIRSKTGAISGFIIPFDTWHTSPNNKVTLICAGEKDMAVARSHSFNAITLTGGEGALSKTPLYFKNRKVVIAYDNDDAGIRGAKKLALQLYKYTKDIKILTNFHEVCKETGEDLTDYFTKYNQSREDLIALMKATEIYEPQIEDIKKNYPILSLREASCPDNLNKMVQSNIQVVAVSDTTFASPSSILAEKIKLTGEKDKMRAGEFREWELTDINCQDMLHLVDNNFREDAIAKNVRNLLRILQTERCVSFKTLTKKTVFKVFVTDLFETNCVDMQPMEYTAYCLDHKLESGKKYLATYKLVPHPYKGQQLVMIITDVVQANDSVSNFKITDEVKEHLNIYKALSGSVSERVDLLTQKIKGLLGYNGNDTLIQTIDLAYHTVLQFNFGNFKNVRGYLDTLVIGESRVGKSSTADTLRETYGLGVFTSLAGNSATVPGLVGGSNKTAGGSFQTRAGIIPQNHKGLIIFEEFGKSNANVVTELTDIRSSNEVRITRVSGSITLPAMVRMISLTNVKNTNGIIKPIASYPNGFSILTELVETAEDIARYDLIVILSDRGASQIDPFWVPETPLAKEVYQARVRWVWSRTVDQIIIDKEVALYIMEKANELNKVYECHIKLFGTEAWKKIIRLAVAVAGYLVSTDETYENIIISKEHVDYAVDFFIRIYDNETFKLKEYVTHEKRYSTCDEESIAALQDIFDKMPALVLQLEQCATTSKNMLTAATGLTNDEINKILNRLSRCLFIRFQNHEIIPTERFRLSSAKINRTTHIGRIGEYA